MHTVVDIGGQDVKVIEIENGMMKNFVMNDKCAAGTGRFLDVMARVLEVRVEDLGDLGDKSTKEIGISSTCTVFAESEVISQLAVGTDKCDIIAGIHRSVAGRVSGLCNRVGVRDLSLIHISSAGFYYNKAKAENTAGGIVFESACGRQARSGQDCDGWEENG